MRGFDYELPERLIAQEPLADRASSRLLHIDRATGEIHHRRFRDVATLLREGDLLVVNDTRVTAMRLLGRKPTGGVCEIFPLTPVVEREATALVRPGRRLRPGAVVNLDGNVTATVLEELPEGQRRVRFDGPEVEATLDRVGLAPLPPYIHRPLQDRERYQTVYNSTGGSAAAPTAGLHFTQELLAQLANQGVEIAKVNLDVGLDTFRPISAADPSEHAIHGEMCRMPANTADSVARCRGRVIAVGTTATRTLETFAIGPRRVEVGERESRLFIRPGYQFQVVDGMFTNFHMPRTTMLLMLCAMAGAEAVAVAYESAIQQNYRFLSFGDSMLIL